MVKLPHLEFVLLQCLIGWFDIEKEIMQMLLLQFYTVQIVQTNSTKYVYQN